MEQKLEDQLPQDDNKIKKIKESKKIYLLDWEIKRSNDYHNYDKIVAYGKEKDTNKTISVIFNDSVAYCYMACPTTDDDGTKLRWGDENMVKGTYIPALRKFFKNLNSEIVPASQHRDDSNFDITCKLKKRIYKNLTKSYYMLYLVFANIKLMDETLRNLTRAKSRYDYKGVQYGSSSFSLEERPYENTLNPILKFHTNRGLNHMGWMEISKYKDINKKYKITSSEIEILAEYNKEKFENGKLKCYFNPEVEDTKDWVIPDVKVLSWDIEQYSSNHDAFPNMMERSDSVYCITMVFEILKKIETRKRYSLLFIPGSSPMKFETERNSDLRFFRNEKELYEEFKKIVNEENPDVEIGYNQTTYDWNVIDYRYSNHFSGEWGVLGRNKVNSTMWSTSWNSSAYSFNDFNILNMTGRVTIDMMIIAMRQLKLPLYNLKSVAMYLLKRTKHDVSAPQMFRKYSDIMTINNIIAVLRKQGKIKENTYLDQQFDKKSVYEKNPLFLIPYRNEFTVMKNIGNYEYIIKKYAKSLIELNREIEKGNNEKTQDNKKISKEEVDEYIKNNKENLSKWINEVFKLQLCLIDASKQKNNFQQYVNRILNSDINLNDLYLYSKTQFELVVNYAVEDSELVMDLFNKMNTLTNMIQSSIVEGVGVKELLYRGQQNKTVAQVYKFASPKNYVLDNIVSEYEGKYTGAIVQKPVRGRSRYVITLDFASMYPSIIKFKNICWTTKLTEAEIKSLKLKPEEYHTLDWTEKVIEKIRKRILKKSVEQMMKDNPNYKPKDSDYKSIVEKVEKEVHHKYYFYKAEYGATPENPLPRRGVLPRIVDWLLKARKEAKGKMGEAKKNKDGLMEIIYDAIQLALKISANSKYGSLGVAKNGKLPLMEGAMSVTYVGRELITKLVEYVVNNEKYKQYNPKLIYGDTDSIMISIECANNEEGVKVGYMMEKDVNENHLKSKDTELSVEFEKIFETLICITQKKYIGRIIDKKTFKTLYNPETYIVKGVLTSRRDNCALQRELFSSIYEEALQHTEHKTFEQARNDSLDKIYQTTQNLLTRNVKINSLIIVKKMGGDYKSDTASLKVLSDILIAKEKPVKPGTRIEFAITIPKTPKLKHNLGEKMVLKEDILMEGCTIDHMYYLKLLEKQIDQIYSFCYGPEINEYVASATQKRNKIEQEIEEYKIWVSKNAKKYEVTENKFKKDYYNELEAKSEKSEKHKKKFSEYKQKLLRMFFHSKRLVEGDITHNPMKNIMKIIKLKTKILDSIKNNYNVEKLEERKQLLIDKKESKKGKTITKTQVKMIDRTIDQLDDLIITNKKAIKYRLQELTNLEKDKNKWLEKKNKKWTDEMYDIARKNTIKVCGEPIIYRTFDNTPAGFKYENIVFSF